MRRAALLALLLCSCATPMPQEPDPPRRPRAREAGIVVGTLPAGPANAITDVEGVGVGHATLVEGEGIRTGATAVLPHGGNLFREKVPAAVVAANAFGKLAGSTQVAELGSIETPIVLTNTLSVPTAAQALLTHALGEPGNEEVVSVNPVVAECNDSALNDIRRRALREEDVLAAIRSASTAAPEEGCVGAGTGVRCLGFKGGIGTASRRLPPGRGGYTVGVLAQTNFGGSLVIAGVPVGRELGGSRREADRGGSCILVVATDAPLLDRNLGRLARRALAALSRVGSSMSPGSGDYAIAFSTAPENRIPHRPAGPRRPVEDDRAEVLGLLFQAALEAAEEAILNALFCATDTTGFGGRSAKALPIEETLQILRRRGALPGR